jgi:hypothetical protein
MTRTSFAQVKERTMSLPSVPGVQATPRVSTSVAEPSQNPSPRPAPTEPEVDIDKVTLQPLPPRFPWLSRLSLQLEAASQQRAPFQPAPLLGDLLDRSA